MDTQFPPDAPYVVEPITACVTPGFLPRVLDDGNYSSDGLCVTIKGDWAFYENGRVRRNSWGIHDCPKPHAHGMIMAEWNHQARHDVWSAWGAYREQQAKASRRAMNARWEAQKARVAAIEAKLTLDEIKDLKAAYRKED